MTIADTGILIWLARYNKLEGYQHIFLEKMPLAKRFPKRKQQIHIRRRAIAVLADIGDQNSVAALLEAEVDNELSRATYQAASDIFTRVG